LMCKRQNRVSALCPERAGFRNMKFTKSADLRDLAIVAIPLLCVMGFLVDLKTTRGIDDWIWYYVALILTIFLQKRQLPFILTGLSTALILVGYYCSSSGAPANDNMALINMASGIGVMWITATMLFFQQKLHWEWRRSEARFSSLFDNMQAGFMQCRLVHEGQKPKDVVVLAVNPAFEAITGLKRASGKAFSDIIPGVWTQQPEILKICDRVASTGKPMKFEMHLKKLNVWLNVSAYSLAKGRFAATLESATERKTAENASTLFRALIDRSSDGIEVVDPNTGQFHDVNEVTCWRLGYKREEMLAMRLSDVTPNVKPEAWPEIMADLRQRRSVIVEGLHRRKDGSTFPTETSIRWVELEREYLVVVVRDITERKRAQDELRQSEDRLRMVTENARVGLVMVDPERRYMFTNGPYFEMLGLPAVKIIGKSVAEVLAPIYEEQIRPRLDRAFKGERVSYELRRPLSNEERFFSVKYEPITENGIVTRVVAVITDVTEQKRANEEIQEQLDELQHWQSVMVGREERILGLKNEVNELLVRQGRERRYSKDRIA
jgi:PAS domain S-box-containing protein